MEAPTGASGHLCPSVAPLQASIPQGCSSLYPLLASLPPPAGVTRQPRPHSEPQDPLCPGPGQGSPLPLGGASGAQDPFTQPHAHPPILPGSSGHVSTSPSPSALLWAFPGEAGVPCGSVKGGVFPPPSLSLACPARSPCSDHRSLPFP